MQTSNSMQKVIVHMHYSKRFCDLTATNSFKRVPSNLLSEDSAAKRGFSNAPE